MHHIISDGWSVGLFINELGVLYSAFLRGDADPLPELEVQYADYAGWQRQWIEGDILRQQTNYWRTTLAGAPALLDMPLDHPRPGEQDLSGACVRCILDEEITAGLKGLSRRNCASLFVTLLAGWAVLLARLSGQQDVVVGSPVANRGQMETEKLIGFFVNTLALRIDLSGSPTVRELLARTKKTTLDAQRHQDIPFEQVVELLHPVRSLSYSPLFQAMFAWQNAPAGSFKLPGLEVTFLQSVASVKSKFDLSLSLREEDNIIRGELVYATSLFDPTTINRYLEYFRNLLRSMVADDTKLVERLPVLTEFEHHRVLHEWNDTENHFTFDKCVHELFEEQVIRTPNAVAAVFDEEYLSYSELNRRADQLADYLREQQRQGSIGPYIATCLKPGTLVVISWLAILKCGCAFVALDPEWPESRLQQAVNQTGSSLLITDSDGGSHVAANVRLVCPSDWIDRVRVEAYDDETVQGISGNIDSAMYVIFTSGSTGKPKAVANAHRGIINRLHWMTSTMPFGSAECVVQTTRHTFDSAVWQIFWPLIQGGKVIIPDYLSLGDSQYIFNLVCQHEATTIDFVPSVLDGIVDGAYTVESAIQQLASLRVVIVGGEESRPTTLRRFAALIPKALLFNLYGPTEASIGCVFHIVSDEDLREGRRIPIGRPIANCRAYVLDLSGLEPVPIGVTGELYLGGTCLGLGYVNDIQRTGLVFVNLTVNGRRELLYRTGDLARWRSDGELEFLGRKDSQVKIRGFRIELEEIESTLVENPAIRKAVVLVRENSPGERQLVAYYVSIDDSIDKRQLQQYLSTRLPNYMMPIAYVKLSSFPVTSSGKLDRDALPAPDAPAYELGAYSPPQGEIECTLAAIWAEVLKLARVGRHDDFFALGGHSLLAIQVVNRVRRELGREVAIRDVFTRPTLIDLAGMLEGAYSPRSSSFPARYSQRSD